MELVVWFPVVAVKTAVAGVSSINASKLGFAGEDEDGAVLEDDGAGVEIDGGTGTSLEYESISSSSAISSKTF